MVSMIPFGLLAGFAGDREIRITELDETGFGFRVCKGSFAADLEKGKAGKTAADVPLLFMICFYNLEKGRYCEVKISSYDLKKDANETSEFYAKFWVTVDQPDYVQAVQRLLGQYSRYIHLKLEEDESELAKRMTGYPGELDQVKCGSLEEQMQIWDGEVQWDRNAEGTQEYRSEKLSECEPETGQKFADICKDGSGIKVWKGSDIELALELDRKALHTDYLRMSLGDFTAKYAGNSIGVCREILQSGHKLNRLYIGNQFCPLLFPDENLLFEMMEKAVAEQLEITLVFSYLREYQLDSVSHLLREIDRWCQVYNCQIEAVVNDWGMAEILKNQTENLVPCLGTLLNKRKKDPRISYKIGDKKLFEKNNLNADFYRDFLWDNYRINRLEWEACGYMQQFPTGKNSLHLPFYQTNTSQYCPLRAVCINGERGRQKLAQKCPEYCREYAFLYPEHLHMTGRYNSLFGMDMDVLKNEIFLESYINNGIDRLVIGLI